jgi:hypothetical protein
MFDKRRNPMKYVPIVSFMLLAALNSSMAAEVPVPAPAAPSLAASLLRELTSDGTLEFTLEDKIRLPDFWWPATLLSYPVKFKTPPRVEALRLRDLISGEEIPFQLSEADGDFARVNFISDLPSGGLRRFELSAAAPSRRPEPKVKQSLEGNVITLDTGVLQVRLPASQPVTGKVPGSILALNRGLGWIGDSRIISPKRAVKSIVTETVESGPLFITCRVNYQFEGGAVYAATIRAIEGYDHVEFFEEMQGLSKEDGVFFENRWSDFHPTHRWIADIGEIVQAVEAQPIDQPVYTMFRGEDPAFTGPSGRERPEEELRMWMNIGPPNATSGSKEVAFWNAANAQGIGLFIRDVAKWQDHEYSVWASGDMLRPRFRFEQGMLYWRWPLVTGTRSTGVAGYEHKPFIKDPPSESVKFVRDPDNRILFLRSRYGGLSLNRVKDWQLTYPGVPPGEGSFGEEYTRVKDAAEFDRVIRECSVMRFSKDTIHAVAVRDFRSRLLPNFVRLYASMTHEQRERATALLLLGGYAMTEEEVGPLQTMLGGHPNYMVDYLHPHMALAHVFPDHPMAREWRERFEKGVELLALFNTRPDVPGWSAKGGRWTENLACYNFAAIEPIILANELGMASDGLNRLATPALVLHGDYLVGVLSAPVTNVLLAAAPKGPPLPGPLRIHPPMGAHSGRRATSGLMHELGQAFLRYRPLTGEHLMWAAAPMAGTSMHDGGKTPVAGVNSGTNPRLKSGKYTGFGLVLRASVDTPDEISVFLQQLDKGPNYRWGFANEGGCGDIYYYAGGKSYSGHMQEDAGDRRVQDATLSCNTGVYKDKNFYSIGMNELTLPFYNLETAQFAELASRGDPDPYSWPDYLRRSVMLAGSDYIVIYDTVEGLSNTRFSWNCGPGDEMPYIHFIKGGENWPTEIGTKLRNGESKGLWRESHWRGGDRMTLVSHKPEVKPEMIRKKAGVVPDPWVKVQTADSTDYLFQDQKPIDCNADGLAFQGTAGMIRMRKDGGTKLALFHGSKIGAKEVVLAVDDPDLGISAAFHDPGEISGVFFSPRGGTLSLTSGKPGKFYVDGAPASFTLPSGEHRWEYTSRMPEPMPPEMLRSENRSGGATVFFTPVAGAERYRIELSRDTGASWQTAGETATGKFELDGLTNESKVHVRAVALNRERESRPAAEYPVYISCQAPLPPEGFKAVPGAGAVELSWGEVLGASEYRLYRREQGAGEYKEIFRGLTNRHRDSNPGVRPPFEEPGRAANLLRAPGKVFEYAVAAVNGNGEGVKSTPADTDAASWRNWYPHTELRFKRQSAYWLPPYVSTKEVPEPYYPK